VPFPAPERAPVAGPRHGVEGGSVVADDLRVVADYLFELAERARLGGHTSRAMALELAAEDYEAELAVRARLAADGRAAELHPAS
jgi:hypothetical protein